MMNGTSHRIQVLSPIKGTLWSLAAGVICFGYFTLVDHYAPPEFRRSFWLLIPLYIIIGALIQWFSRLSTTSMELRITPGGLWMEDLPTWKWGKKESIYIGWLALEYWSFKKGRFDGHSIWWDRLRFKLSDGGSILLIPSDEFDPNKGAEIFLTRLGQAILAYNSLPSTAIPIGNGPPRSKTLFMDWMATLLSLFFTLMTILALYIYYIKGKTGWIIPATALLLLAFVYQLWTRIQKIRKN